MSKICYQSKKFSTSTTEIINHANVIIREYQNQGFMLTLRQIYYQFVSRGLIANKVQEYKRLGGIISDARLAGQIDWKSIEDRTRELKEQPHWGSPAEIMDAAAQGFALDKWRNQPVRIEIWIEKEALAGVFERVCKELDVPFFCCRGYTSQSEMWVGAMRLVRHSQANQTPVILHFGDHDPSGIDMTRDIIDRMQVFGLGLTSNWQIPEGRMVMQRLALNMDQVEQYQPPPNPAKETDSRFQGYIQKFGHESWELDALEPQVLANLVRNAVLGFMDRDEWERVQAKEADQRALLTKASENWAEVSEYLGNL